ncbi:MAG: hypothetical protein K6F52_05630 [Clostridia bacterium]|nr:hypothetical protein [Clostridia bacterium]
MDKECLRRCLSDAGCCDEVTEIIIERLESGNKDDMLRLIKKERCRAMAEYHEIGRKVDCMDFALRNLEKEMKEKGGIRK